MILTFKIKHHENFSQELEKAYQVALFAIHNRDCSSSKDVKHLGLKSVISNQILKKYGKNKKCKRVSKENIKLVIPHQGIKLDQKKNLIEITSLKKKFLYHLNKAFEKINQIEIDNHYYYLSVTLTEAPLFQSTASIGVDLNATGHSCVVATPQGKVYKLGKKTPHLKKKYKHIRKKLQHQKKWKKLKKIKKENLISSKISTTRSVRNSCSWQKNKAVGLILKI